MNNNGQQNNNSWDEKLQRVVSFRKDTFSQLLENIRKNKVAKKIDKYNELFEELNQAEYEYEIYSIARKIEKLGFKLIKEDILEDTYGNSSRKIKISGLVWNGFKKNIGRLFNKEIKRQAAREMRMVMNARDVESMREESVRYMSNLFNLFDKTNQQAQQTNNSPIPEPLENQNNSVVPEPLENQNIDLATEPLENPNIVPVPELSEKTINLDPGTGFNPTPDIQEKEEVVQEQEVNKDFRSNDYITIYDNNGNSIRKNTEEMTDEELKIASAYLNSQFIKYLSYRESSTPDKILNEINTFNKLANSQEENLTEIPEDYLYTTKIHHRLAVEFLKDNEIERNVLDKITHEIAQRTKINQDKQKEEFEKSQENRKIERKQQQAALARKILIATTFYDKKEINAASDDEVLNDVIDLQKYSPSTYETAKNKVTISQIKQRMDIEQKELEDNKQNIVTITSQITKNQNKINQLKAIKLNSNQTEKRKLQSSIEKLEETQEKFKSEKTRLENRYKNIKANIEYNNQKLNDLKAPLNPKEVRTK